MSQQRAQSPADRARMSRAIVTVLERLEDRRLLCADHAGHLTPAPVASDVMRKTAAVTKTKAVTPTAQQTKAVGKVMLTRASVTKSVTRAVDAQAAQVAAAAVADPVTFPVTAAGLPILNSRSDGQGLKVFIDWDGASGNGFNDDGFSTDGDLTTFNAAEQAIIYSTWRDIVSAFSMLNVNVTTVQPPTGGNNPAFVWQRITNSRAGGAAYVNWIVNYESHGYNNSDNALYRHSGIYHELGHQMGLDHQSAYDNAGNKTAEYISGYDTLHGVTMGVDYNGNIKKWVIGRDTYAADSFQDDLYDMGRVVGGLTGSDGFAPDDFTGTTFATATTLPITNGAYQTAGNIERLFDADYFSFTSTGGAWNVNVEPTFQSPVELKLEVYDSAGTLLGSISDGLYRNAQDNASQDLNLTLSAGTYYAKVTSAQNAGDQGEYAFYATPLPAGWQSVDINRGNTGRGGYATYDSSTGTFFQGGSGGDIWNQSDAFRYSYQTLTGDGSITARVDRLDNTSVNAKAGVMIRQSTDANARLVYLGLKPSGQIETIARSTAGGTAFNVVNTAGQVGPWVRLTRAGNTFTLARSADGTTWTTVATTTVTMTGPVLIGLATNSQNFGAQTTSSFTNVTTTGNLGTPAVTYNGLAAPANLTATPVATQSTGIVLNWADVAGETGYRVERSLDNNTFTSIGTVGANITTLTDTANGWGTMRYWYRVTALTAAGNSAYSDATNSLNKPGQPGLLQAIKMSATRVSLSWRDVNGDAGYRVERSTNGGTSYTTLGTTPQNVALFNDGTAAAGTAYTYRITPLSSLGDGVPLTFNVTTQLPATSSISLSNSTSNSLTVNWSAVTNAAGYRIYRSTDNANWSQVATINTAAAAPYVDTGLNPLTNYYYYVVAVASDGAVGINSAVAKGSTAPAAALPTPWLDADIGNVTGIGKAGGSGGAFTINTSGSDIANPDSFHFVYQPVTGNTTIVARVASLANTDPAAKAGLMIRQNLTSATAPYAGIFLNAGNGYGIDLRSRGTAGGNYQYGQGLANVAAPYWLKLQRAGNVFTMSYSADGTNWTVAGTRAVSMTGTVYVGLAATAFSTSLMNTSTFTNVSLPSASPTVATAVSASPNPVTGKTTALSVLGADDGGEANLTYAWSATGPADVSFSAAGTNAAKNSVATFTKAGTYTVTATISDGGFNTVTSSTTVTVVPVFTAVAAAQSSVFAGFTQQVNAVDQFGDAMTVSGLIWSTSAGSISSSGLFLAPTSGAASATVTGQAGAASFSTTIAVAAPRTWYKADTVASGTLIDHGTNSGNATLTGAYAADSSGLIGAAVSLTGGHAIVPASTVSGLTDFTISAWVKPSATTNWSRVFDFGTGTGKYMFLAAADGSGYVRFAATANGNGAEQTITTNRTLTNGVWSHIAVTLAGNIATLYINGVAVGTNASFTLSPAVLGSLTQLYLGKSQYADPTFKGSIDDFRVYSAAAPAATIAALYNGGTAYAASTPTGLTASATSATSVGLVWNDNSPGEVAYVLERATNAAFTTGLISVTLPPATTAYTDTAVNAATTYYYRVTAVLPGGTTAGPAVAGPVTTPAAVATPTLGSVTLNDGSTQRSMVNSITLVFSGPVHLQAGAIVLSGISGNVSDITYAITPGNDAGTYTLTFPAFANGSLDDGTYRLTLNAALITAVGTATPMTADTVYAFHRLFGDGDGNGRVDFNDFLGLQTAFGTTPAAPGWNAAYDADNNAVIDFNDFLQLQTRFGTILA